MGAYIDFDKSSPQIQVQIATSFISIEQARMNLEHEVPEWDFKQLCNNTKKAWNDKLSKFHIKGNNKDDAPIFYTALYHCYLFPREFSEYGKYTAPLMIKPRWILVQTTPFGIHSRCIPSLNDPYRARLDQRLDYCIATNV